MTVVTSVFWKIVSMSLSASVFVILVAAVRSLAKGLPKRLPCILWTVVTVRLLLPFSIRGSFSLVPRSVATFAENVSAIPSAGETATPFAEAVSTGAEAVASPAAAAPALSLTSVLPVVWLAGVLVFALLTAVSAVRTKRRLADCRPFDATGFDLPRRTRVYIAAGLSSAFVTGFFRPAIYLPEGLSDDEARCVLAHESAHLRHGDPTLKAFAFAALILHWMNPLVWLAFRLFGADMEMAADEAVLARGDGFAKADYSQVILNFAAGKTGLPMSTLAFGSGSVKGRIRNVLRFRRIPRPLLTAVTTLVLAVGLVMLWDPPATVSPNVTEVPDTAQAVTDFPTIPEQETLPRLPDPQQADDTDDETPGPVETTAPPVSETLTQTPEPASVETPAVTESAVPADASSGETPDASAVMPNNDAGTTAEPVQNPRTVVFVNLKGLRKE